jgi:hypothetical protein
MMPLADVHEDPRPQADPDLTQVRLAQQVQNVRDCPMPPPMLSGSSSFKMA